MSSVDNVGFGTGRTVDRMDNSESFEWEITGYIIDDDFYIVALRLIFFTDSLIIIIYLLLK